MHNNSLLHKESCTNIKKGDYIYRITGTWKPPTPLPNESLDEIYQYWREQLSGEVLDELCDDIKNDDHEGACWDVVNQLSEILSAPTQALINNEVVKARKKSYEDGLNDGQEVQKYQFYRMIRHRKENTAPNSGAGRELKDIMRELKK